MINNGPSSSEKGLESRLAEAESRNQHLDKVLRSYAHDIRNNLGTIQSLAEIVHMDVVDSPNGAGGYNISNENLEYIQDIAKVASDSIDIAQNYLALARIENGTYILQPENFNFLGTIYNVVKEVTLNKSKRVGVEYTSLEKEVIKDFSDFRGEKTKIKTILQNLVKNAYEAAPEYTKLGVSLGSEEYNLIVSISNQGTIPQELRTPEKLFSFGTTSGKYNGNGIGTYTAKLFAKAHGGDINFRTDDESNSTQFILKLPKFYI